MNFLKRLSLAVIGLAAIASLTASAQTNRTWDGGGDADASGNWSTAANWTADNVPDTNTERAILNNVAVGSRTVTNDVFHRVHSLHMNQSTAGAVNTLVLDDNLRRGGSGEGLHGNVTIFESSNTTGAIDALTLDFNGRTFHSYHSHGGVISWNVNHMVFDLTTPGSAFGMAPGANNMDRVANRGRIDFGADSAFYSRPSADGSAFATAMYNYGEVNAAGAGGSFVGHTTHHWAALRWENGSATETEAELNVGTGAVGDTHTMVVSGKQVELLNHAGNATTVAENATLRLYAIPNATNPWEARSAKGVNSGDFSLAGTVESSVTGSSRPGDMVVNTGNFVVDGAAAKLLLTTGGNVGSWPATFRNQAGGTLSGSGTLTYHDLAHGDNRDQYRVMEFYNLGTISPGTSPGDLELAGMNVIFQEGGRLVVEIGGVAPGEYDTFTVSSFDPGYSGGAKGGLLDLSTTGDSLEIVLVDDYIPQVGDSWDVISAVSVLGDFDTVILPKRMTGGWDGVTFTLTGIPEPTSLALVALASLTLLRRRRRW